MYICKQEKASPVNSGFCCVLSPFFSPLNWIWCMEKIVVALIRVRLWEGEDIFGMKMLNGLLVTVAFISILYNMYMILLLLDKDIYTVYM